MYETPDDPRLIEHRDAHNREHQALAHEKAWREAASSPLPHDARSFVAAYITIVPVQSARDAWFEASCDYSGCSWSTTGWEPVCEEAAYEHAASHLATPSPLPTDEEALVSDLAEAGVERGYAGGEAFRRTVAKRLCAKGWRRSVVSTPGDAREAVLTSLRRSHVGEMVSKTPEAHRRMVAEGIFDALSAVSAPPTITDEMRRALTSAAWEALEPRLEDHIHLDLNDVEENAQFRSIVDAVVESAVAALGGEDKVG